MKELKGKKAVGWDDIPNEFLKEAGESLRKALVTIFNKIRTEQNTPQQWTQDKAKLLYKGKSKQSLDNYRGIAITSNIGKLFCRIMGKRLQNIVEERNWLGEIQAAF